PELTIEGFKEFEAIRDFLYTRMRGYQGGHITAAPAGTSPQIASVPAASSSGSGADEAVSLLLAIGDELKRTRELLESGKPSSTAKPPAGSSAPAAPQKTDWWKG